MPLSTFVKEWIDYAKEDLSVAKNLLDDGEAFRTVCFHSEQAVEKYLKAYLAHHEKTVRKIHDLTALLDDCVDIDSSFGKIKSEIGYLDGLYINTRYPDDFRHYEKEEAERALKTAEKVTDFIAAKLGD